MSNRSGSVIPLFAVFRQVQTDGLGFFAWAQADNSLDNERDDDRSDDGESECHADRFHLIEPLAVTSDGGRKWRPVKGPRCTSWLGGDFLDGKSGALAGAWSRLGTLRDGNLGKADVDQFGGRNLRGMQLREGKSFAVGQGPRNIAAADFNGDGKVDLAVADYDGYDIGILLNSS